MNSAGSNLIWINPKFVLRATYNRKTQHLEVIMSDGMTVGFSDTPEDVASKTLNEFAAGNA